MRDEPTDRYGNPPLPSGRKTTAPPPAQEKDAKKKKTKILIDLSLCAGQKRKYFAFDSVILPVLPRRGDPFCDEL